jgi:hypothetical protein
MAPLAAAISYRAVVAERFHTTGVVHQDVWATECTGSAFDDVAKPLDIGDVGRKQ